MHPIKSRCADYLVVLETQRLDEHSFPLFSCPDAVIVVRPALILDGGHSLTQAQGNLGPLRSLRPRLAQPTIIWICPLYHTSLRSYNATLA